MGFRPVPSTPPILVSQGLSSKLIARRRYCRENFWLQKTESSQLNTAGSVVYRYVYMRIPIHKPTGFTSRPTGYQHPPDRSFLFCILRHSYPCIPPKYPFVSSLEPHRHEKILLQRIHTLANFPFLLLTTSPAPTSTSDVKTSHEKNTLRPIKTDRVLHWTGRVFIMLVCKDRSVFLHTRPVIFSASFWPVFSKATSNQNQWRKKFSYLNQLCSFICVHFPISTLLLSRSRQKAKLRPIKEKCNSSHGHALNKLFASCSPFCPHIVYSFGWRNPMKNNWFIG